MEDSCNSVAAGGDFFPREFHIQLMVIPAAGAATSGYRNRF